MNAPRYTRPIGGRVRGITRPKPFNERLAAVSVRVPPANRTPFPRTFAPALTAKPQEEHHHDR